MTKKQRVEDYRATHPGAGPREIADETGLNYNTVRSAVSDDRAREKHYEGDYPEEEDIELTINLPGEQLAAGTPWWTW